MKKYLTLVLASSALVACATTPPPPSIEEGGIAAAKTFAENVAPECVPQEFEVYFGTDDTRLSPEFEAVIAIMAKDYAACSIKSVRVTGYADSVGDPQTNLDVSEARAKLVADALTEAGIVAPRLDIEAVGEKNATTDDGLAKPLRRKTVVSIET